MRPYNSAQMSIGCKVLMCCIHKVENFCKLKIRRSAFLVTLLPLNLRFLCVIFLTFYPFVPVVLHFTITIMLPILGGLVDGN